MTEKPGGTTITELYHGVGDPPGRAGSPLRDRPGPRPGGEPAGLPPGDPGIAGA